MAINFYKDYAEKEDGTLSVNWIDVQRHVRGSRATVVSVTVTEMNKLLDFHFYFVSLLHFNVSSGWFRLKHKWKIVVSQWPSFGRSGTTMLLILPILKRSLHLQYKKLVN